MSQSAASSKITNEPKGKFPLIVAIRELLEHRALWMYLLCDEAAKAGADPAVFAPAAVKRCGLFQGMGLVEKGGGTSSLKSLKSGLFGKAAQMVFEMDIKEVDDDRFELEFHYCPLVKAWQKQGASDEEIGRLCDWAMCGDRGIGEAYGCKMDLPKAIARGDEVCHLIYYRPECAKKASSGESAHGCSMSNDDVLDVAEVVALEKRIAEEGTSLATLMDRAGAAVADAVLADMSSRCASGAARKGVSATEGDRAEALFNVVILAGSGNNGGDGWVAARLLAEACAPANVTLVTPKPASKISAQPAHDAAEKAAAVLKGASDGGHAGSANAVILVDPGEGELYPMLEEADIIVDAMLGTGFSGDSLRSPYDSWVRALDKARWHDPSKTVISVDCPTGLNAQTGKAAVPTVSADVTVTMLVKKTGLVEEAACPYVGKLVVADLTL